MEPNNPTPPALNIPPTQKGPKANPLLLNLRTMKGDVAEALKRQNESLVSITLAEEKQRMAKRAVEEAVKERTHDPIPAPKRIGRFVIAVVFILVFGGISFALFLLWPKITLITFNNPFNDSKKATEEKPPAALKQTYSLIPANTERRFTLGEEIPAEMFSSIAQERRLGISENIVRSFSFSEPRGQGDVPPASQIPIHRLLSLTGTSVPETFTRTLATPFMVGLLGEAKNVATPFIVLKVLNKNAGLAGALDVEQKLPNLFDTLFGTHVSVNNLPQAKFRSIVVGGFDARIMGHKNGVTVYTFADASTLIITQSKTALEKLLLLSKGR